MIERDTKQSASLSKQQVNLYIVAVPIGNPEDITLRALNVLKEVDITLCEDSRVTGKLLKKLGISSRMICYNDFSDERDRKNIFKLIDEGKTLALVSDAGTPMISDPGFKLIRQAQDEGYIVESLPGACSVITALTLSGLPTDKFFFDGFLPSKTSGRKQRLSEIKDLKATIVFFDAARRLVATLSDMEEVLGKTRECCVIREITKRYEEVKRNNIPALKEYYSKNEPKGEVVIVLAPPEKKSDFTDDEIEEQIVKAMQSMSMKDAVAFVSENTSKRKKDVYSIALRIN